jgi:glycosyltransferase involved in cell wall biosynthesis
MKVLLINNIHYYRGGAETVYFNIARLLKEYGNEVIFFSQKDNNMVGCEQAPYFVNKKIQVKDDLFNKIRYLFYYFYNKQAAVNLDLLLSKEKPDIAHVHLVWGGMTSSILPILKKNNVPVVHTTHDYRLICPAYAYLDGEGKICESCKDKKYYHCLIKKCSKNHFLQSMVMCLEMYYRNIFFNPAKFIDGFIFPSNFSRSKHFQYRPDFSQKKNIVLYNFSDIDNIDKEKKDYFLYYGRISIEKGIYTLFEAMKKLPHINLKIAGSGPELKKLVDNAVNNIGNIEFLGNIYGQELKSLVSQAYFVIVPSEWYENNPMTIVESYSYGTPVIGTEIGGIPEIIEDGKTGYLCKPHNVQDLIKKIKFTLSLSKNEYEWICMNAYIFAKKHFYRKIYCTQLVGFYASVIRKYKVENIDK